MAWALAFAVVGTAAGLALAITGREGLLAPAALGAAAAGGLCGWLAWRVDRRRAGAALLDGHGRLRVPSSLALRAVPLGVGVVGFLALVVVATVYTDSPVAGLAFLAIAVGFATLGRPLWLAARLRRAAEAAQAGRGAEAAGSWERLADDRWVSSRVRDQAALNRGALALAEGDREGARAWYGRVGGGQAKGFAVAGLALLDVLDGCWEDAERRCAEAARAGQAVQAEIDAARLLLVWRRDGLDEARSLGERLVGEEAGVLFLAILAAIRREGDGAGSEALDWGPHLHEALRGSAVARLVPELKPLLEGGAE